MPLLRSESNCSHHIQHNLRFSGDIWPIGTKITLRDRTRGRLRARGAGRGHSRSRLHSSLFLPAVSQTDLPTIASGALGNKQAVDAEPLPSPPVHVLRSGPTTGSCHRSQTELACGFFDRNITHIERILCLFLERKQLVTSLNSAIQRLSDLKEERHVVQVEKIVLVENIYFWAAEIRKLNPEKDSIKNLIHEQYCANAPDRKRSKETDITMDLDLRYVRVASKVLTAVSAIRNRKTAVLCPFVFVEKRRCARRGEIVSHISVVVSFGSMISPAPCDSTPRSGWFYQPPFYWDADLLKAMVLQELDDNAWTAMFHSAEDQAAFVNAIALSRKWRAKLSQCLSDELTSGKCKVKDLLFTTPQYRSLLSEHVPELEEERRPRKYPVRESTGKLVSNSENCEWNYFGIWRS